MSRKFEVRLDDVTGAVAAIRVGGVDFAVPSPESFTLQLRNREGDPRLLKSSEFEEGVHPDFPSLRVETACDCEAGAAVFRWAVSGVPADWVVEWVDAPQICIPYGHELFMPWLDGVVLADPRQRLRPYYPLCFSSLRRPYGYNFPGRCQMQCLASYDETGRGFVMFARDPACVTKAVEVEPLERYARLSMQTFSGAEFGGDCRLALDYRIEPISGGWREACAVYRAWLDSVLAPAKPFPRWMEESPVILIYPVRGHGKDTGEMEPNCYYPYSEILPLAEKLSQRLGSPVMALPMHWEGTAPWAPPYVWPPYGGEAALAALRDGLHQQGNLLGVYCSGTAWTCKSSILPDYAPGCTPEQEKNMLRGPKGELEAAVCNGPKAQRLGYELCLTEEWSRETVRAEVKKMTDFGIDYIQLLDQNLGGATHNCYAQDHRHPPVPGAWQTAAMRSLLAEAGEGSEALFGCECAAAEPFTDLLRLNDARPIFAWREGKPVPAQQFVFHGRSANFSGNQGGAGGIFDHEKSPENLLWRIAYAFNAGDLLSAVLKEDGKPHWNWCLPWSVPGPDPESVWRLMGNLNRLRRAFPQFLLYGRMQPLPVVVDGPEHPMYCKGELRPFDAYFASCWESPAGERALFLVNWLSEEVSLQVGGEAVTLPPLDGLCREV